MKHPIEYADRYADPKALSADELRALLDEQEMNRMGTTGRDLREIYGEGYNVHDLLDQLHYLDQAVDRLVANPATLDLQVADLHQRIEQIRYMVVGKDFKK